MKNRKYDNEFSEKMHTIECGESFSPKGGVYKDMNFIRVPGGWVCTQKEGACFIPFSIEFKKIGQ